MDPDSIYIYPIDVYEAASSNFLMGNIELATEQAREYWESGMTHSQNGRSGAL